MKQLSADSFSKYISLVPEFIRSKTEPSNYCQLLWAKNRCCVSYSSQVLCNNINIPTSSISWEYFQLNSKWFVAHNYLSTIYSSVELCADWLNISEYRVVGTRYSSSITYLSPARDDNSKVEFSYCYLYLDLQLISLLVLLHTATPVLPFVMTGYSPGSSLCVTYRLGAAAPHTILPVVIKVSPACN